MAYSLEEAKELIIKAGNQLVQEKLVARTWGNISARISDFEFVTTPSGVPYDKITNDNLVVCRISDCSYSGDIKPTSERRIHAAVYKLRKDVNFILHTHQNYATAISVDGKDKEFAPCAGYGLPGTKGLLKKVEEKVRTYPYNKAFLMERHGAIVLGDNYDEAFNLVKDLETKSKECYDAVAFVKDPLIEAKPYLDDYAQMFGFGKKDNPNEDQEAKDLVREKNALAARYQGKPKPMGCFDVFIQNFVYKKKYSKIKDNVK